ncbi:hypothetical protein COU53_01655 [Candidatus Pacearchaeota archaeon CG10_big_fil_rev_8_21_14_0_10_30_48]|nr:MAG: hypothetical protein COU53_01655 [Candidatus Pacearchaeota archaeon CG10_big_fil_rev_8_21_14_0_10_30_48]
MKSENNGRNELEERLIQLPSIQAGKGMWQNEYHEFDVYDHTIAVIDALKKETEDIDLISAGYLHDIGKPVSAKLRFYEGVLQEKEPGIPYHTFKDHERIGEELVLQMPDEFFSEYGLNKEKIAKLVGAHYLPMQGIHKMREAGNFVDFLEAYRNLEKAIDKTELDRNEVMGIFLADCIGKGDAPEDQQELLLVRDILLGEGDLNEIYNIQKNTIRRGYAEKN